MLVKRVAACTCLSSTVSQFPVTQLSYHMTHVSQIAGPLAASAFNRLGQYANSPGHRAYCYV